MNFAFNIQISRTLFHILHYLEEQVIFSETMTQGLRKDLVYGIKRIAALAFVLVLGIPMAQATHIRAGEIIAERISTVDLTFRFTFIGFRDTDSGIEFGGGTFDFGDGIATNDILDFRSSVVQVANNIVREEFVIIHRYDAPGTYTVSYREEFRNGGIANMANSINTAFYVETRIVIDPIFGFNNSPRFTVPPIDDGRAGVTFIHNPGAFDLEDDSLAFRLIVPQQANDVEVTDYRLPNDPSYYSNFDQGNEAMSNRPTFTMDPITGDLVWDAPGDFFNLSGSQCPEGTENCAEYNVAFIVEEWVKIGDRRELGGFVVRDMQITITDGDNEQPDLEIPDPLCVEAGTLVNQVVIGTDPDGHAVRLEAFGGPLELTSSPATFSPSATPPDLPPFQDQPGRLDFIWQTVCGHVKELPYSVQFKVSDDPREIIDGELIKIGPTLANQGTWEITVVGPAPQGLAADAATGRSIDLQWEQYFCDNAETMQVYRRVGDFPFNNDDCIVGIPENSGYELVTELPIDSTSFTDDNGGRKLAPGAKYCYRLVAQYPLPTGGTSFASEEVCFTLLADGPVITNVDINSTANDGSVIVRWSPPLEVDPAQFPPPYSYDVYRTNNFFFDGQPQLVQQGVTDEFVVDTGINTRDDVFSYRVALRDAGGNFVDSSAQASSVRLELEPDLNAIGMRWRAEVPWSNSLQEHATHFIFRDNVSSSNVDQLVLIDSVNVTQDGFFYFDDGAFNGTPLDEELEYCYFVTTQGGYDNPILPEPLINRSQIQCARPNDTIPPCQPINLILVDGLDCESILADQSCFFNEFQNEITWAPDVREVCDDDIVRYNIYFSTTGREEDYELIADVEDPVFLHQDLPSFKGCYRVTAVDRSGNESEPSEEFCIDNCPNFILPNVFTPNSDGKNDLFTPLFSNPASPISGFDNNNCPRFIDGVILQVFDRTGKAVFNYDSDDSEPGILINWNGKTDDGRDLPSGVYFYSAELELDVLAASDGNRRINGWVQILR